MKLNKELGGIALKDLIVLALCGGALYWTYSSGYFDSYLPENYSSAVVMKKGNEGGAMVSSIGPKKSLPEKGAQEGGAIGAVVALFSGKGKEVKTPEEVKLLKMVEFPAIFDGKVVGKVEVKAGTLLKLREEKGDEVVLEYMGVTKAVAVSETDLEARRGALK